MTAMPASTFVIVRGDVGLYAVLFVVVITVIPVLVVDVIVQRRLQGSVSQGTMK